MLGKRLLVRPSVVRSPAPTPTGAAGRMHGHGDATAIGLCSTFPQSCSGLMTTPIQTVTMTPARTTTETAGLIAARWSEPWIRVVLSATLVLAGRGLSPN